MKFFKKKKKDTGCCSLKIEPAESKKKSCCDIKIEEVENNQQDSSSNNKK